jgi:hypothetical protein
MGSERALYWIAVAVLAVFAVNNFAVRHQNGVRCLASRSLAAIEQVSPHATSVMAMAEMMWDRGESRFDHSQMALAGVQTRLASAQCVLARHEAAFARVQAEQARIEAIQQLRGAAICQRQTLRMAIPVPPGIRAGGTI